MADIRCNAIGQRKFERAEIVDEDENEDRGAKKANKPIDSGCPVMGY